MCTYAPLGQAAKVILLLQDPRFRFSLVNTSCLKPNSPTFPDKVGKLQFEVKGRIVSGGEKRRGEERRSGNYWTLFKDPHRLDEDSIMDEGSGGLERGERGK